jgi:hypothetical protein
MLKPGDPTIAHNKGRALEALGRLDEAERLYDEALALDPRLLPSLSARAGLLARRGDWIGAFNDLDAALTERPNDPHLRLRRGELLLRQGDWLRGLPDYEARLELPPAAQGGERYAPPLPRWHGEPLSGKLLIYPEQADVASDAAMRDTLLFARGVEAVVQCSPDLAPRLAMPSIGRDASVGDFAAAAPLRSLPLLLGWTPTALPPIAMTAREDGDRIGWFTDRKLPHELEVECDPAHVARCRIAVGDDRWVTHLAARLGIPTLMLLDKDADWVWAAETWYPQLELLREWDDETLAARLARC